PVGHLALPAGQVRRGRGRAAHGFRTRGCRLPRGGAGQAEEVRGGRAEGEGSARREPDASGGRGRPRRGPRRTAQRRRGGGADDVRGAGEGRRLLRLLVARPGLPEPPPGGAHGRGLPDVPQAEPQGARSGFGPGPALRDEVGLLPAAHFAALVGWLAAAVYPARAVARARRASPEAELAAHRRGRMWVRLAHAALPLLLATGVVLMARLGGGVGHPRWVGLKLRVGAFPPLPLAAM